MTATLAPTAKQTQAAKELAAATIVLELRMFAPGFRRKLESNDIIDAEDTVARDAIYVRKDLIDPKALGKIGKARSRFKRWVQNRTIACGMLRGGDWLTPLTLVEEVAEGIDAYVVEDRKLVEELIEKYESLKEEAKVRLASHFNASDYPSAEQVRGAYGISYKFVGFNVPAALQDLNRELYEKELAKVEAECVLAKDEIMLALRESAVGLVEHMADRLGNDASGKPKVFRDTTVTQMKDFLATFAARNLTGDSQLADLMAEAQKLLQGVTPETLRKQETTRERVLTGMAEIKAKMDAAGLITKTRQFAMDEEV